PGFGMVQVELGQFRYLEVFQVIAVFPPVKPIMVPALFICARLLEPGMITVNMVGHEIHDQPDAALPRGLDELLKSPASTEAFLDAEKISHMVSMISRGPVEGGQPYRINPQFRQVIQLCGHSLQVAAAKDRFPFLRLLPTMPQTSSPEETINKNVIDDGSSEPVCMVHGDGWFAQKKLLHVNGAVAGNFAILQKNARIPIMEPDLVAAAIQVIESILVKAAVLLHEGAVKSMVRHDMPGLNLSCAGGNPTADLIFKFVRFKGGAASTELNCKCSQQNQIPKSLFWFHCSK